MSLNPALLSEGTVDLIIKHLKDNFNAYAAHPDFQYTDGISLEPVNSFYINRKFESLDLPAIYVLIGAHIFQYQDNQNYLNAEDDVLIVLSAEDTDTENLTRKMFRYGRILHALFNIQDLSTADGRLKLVTVPSRLGYAEDVISAMPKQAKRFRMDAVLELKVQHYENNLTI